MKTDDLEKALGSRIRDLRINSRLTQAELAERANVSLGALKHLEGGSPATTSTLLKVLRALGEERWVDALGPGPDPFNPLALLDAHETRRRVPPRPKRVRRRREAKP